MAIKMQPRDEMPAYVHRMPHVPICLSMGSYRVVRMKLMNHIMAIPKG